DSFDLPALQGVRDVLLTARPLFDGVEGSLHPARCLEQVLEIAGGTVQPMIVESANLDLPARDEEGLRRLAHSLLGRLTELSLTREYSVLKQRLQRTDPSDAERHQEIMARLAQVQGRRRALRAMEE